MTVHSVDVVVVGAGPAGLSAALELSGGGLSTLVIDEQPAPGGQIYRGAENASPTAAGQFGQAYLRGAELIAEFRASGAEYLPEATVVNVDGQFAVDYLAHGVMRRVHCRALILATGAYERPVPLPGWTLPGVMTAGAGQVLAKQSGVVPDGPVALVGNGPLLWLLAWQYRQLGVDLTAIVTFAPAHQLRASMRHLPQFVLSPYFREGLKYLTDARRNARIVKVRKEQVRVVGTDGPEAIEISDQSAKTLRLDAQTVLLHDGLLPSIHLSGAVGCELNWSNLQQSWRPRKGRWQETSRPGLFVAGDGAGIEGAGAAECTGRLAALGVLRHLGALAEAECDIAGRSWRAAHDRHMAGRLFLDTWFAPAGSLRFATPETVACRCEAVSVAQAEAAVSPGPNRLSHLKSMTRCGMGPCQGRMCHPTTAALGERLSGVAPMQAGPPSYRFPVKPVPVTALAGLDAGQVHDVGEIRE